jgi:hypothetical protein
MTPGMAEARTTECTAEGPIRSIVACARGPPAPALHVSAQGWDHFLPTLAATVAA